MNKKESLEYFKNMYDIYSGILYNTQEFNKGIIGKIDYHFDCQEFIILKEKYNLEKIAKKGSQFNKAKRLLNYLSIRLTHKSDYNNHINCNSLDLLEYSLNNPEHGINCLNKSKILEECCLALNIYARRVGIYPYSPYDLDNHVVTEIFDKRMNKWIMLDPTTNGYFINEELLPLSCLEIREHIANRKFVTFIGYKQSTKDLNKLRITNMATNQYIAKNMAYFIVDQTSRFGKTDNYLQFYPKNLDMINRGMQGWIYRKSCCESMGFSQELIDYCNSMLEEEKKNNHESIDIQTYLENPYRGK